MSRRPHASPAIALALLVQLAACSESQDPRVQPVGLDKLTVRDGAVGDADVSASGTDAGGDPSGGSGTDSVSVFRRTAYPLLRDWCQGCHSGAVSPVIAHEDVAVAHEALLLAQKVDFQDAGRSRIVLRLAADNHNCPAQGCEAAAAAMEAAVSDWAESLVAAGDAAPPDVARTPALTFAAIETRRIGADNPTGVIRLEAESGVFKAPMAAFDLAGSSGGKVVQSPMGSGSQNNAQTAAASNTLGTVVYDFDVTAAGTYRMHGLVNAPALTSNSFWVRMDNGALQGWVFPANGAAFTWDLADNVVDVGAPLQFNLTAGTHRLELRQREEQTKVDVLVLTSDPNFNPANAKPPFRDVSILTFDLADEVGVPGAKLTVEASDYSENAYLFRNPTLVLPSGSAIVKGMRLMINGVYLPQHATYTVVDANVSAPGGLLSTAALVALKDKGPDADEFHFTFDTLEVAP